MPVITYLSLKKGLAKAYAFCFGLFLFDRLIFIGNHFACSAGFKEPLINQHNLLPFRPPGLMHQHCHY